MLEWLSANWLVLWSILLGLINMIALFMYKIRVAQYAVTTGGALESLADVCEVLSNKVNECVDLVNEPVKIDINVQEIPATNVKPTKGMN
jgi:hypothetical protein